MISCQSRNIWREHRELTLRRPVPLRRDLQAACRRNSIVLPLPFYATARSSFSTTRKPSWRGWPGANLGEENYDESQEKPSTVRVLTLGLLVSFLGWCSQCRSTLPGPILIAVRSALGPGSASSGRVSAQIRGCSNARIRGDPGTRKLVRTSRTWRPDHLFDARWERWKRDSLNSIQLMARF
jgi:hypothetical protein